MTVVQMRLLLIQLFLLSMVIDSSASEKRSLLRIDADARDHGLVHFSSNHDERVRWLNSMLDEVDMIRLLQEESLLSRTMSLSFDPSVPSTSASPATSPLTTLIPVVPTPSTFPMPIDAPTAESLPTGKTSPPLAKHGSPETSKPLLPTQTKTPATSIPTKLTAPSSPSRSMKPVSSSPFSAPPPSTATPDASRTTILPTVEVTSMVSDPPTLFPNSSLAPTQVVQNSIYTCTGEGSVGLVETPPATRTLLNFKVGYLVESFEPLNDYIVELERRILLTALLGALQCNASDFLINSTAEEVELFSGVAISTNGTGEICTPEISMCTVLETEFTVHVAENIDPEVGAFLGYVMLRKEMDAESFLNSAIDRCQYLSPLPLLPPVIENDKTSGADSFPDVQSADNISVSPWTVGAVLAMSAGGLVALVAWMRNRRNRNRRHMQLIEDMSATSQAA